MQSARSISPQARSRSYNWHGLKRARGGYKLTVSLVDALADIRIARSKIVSCDKEELLEQVVGLLGGRAAEEFIFGVKTTGASARL